MFTQADVIDTLNKARELVKIGWIRSDWAKNKEGKSVQPWSEDACEWCTEGAILAITHFHPDDRELADACVRILQAGNPEFSDIGSLTRINRGQTGSPSQISKASMIPLINDRGTTTQKQIVRMFSNGIVLARNAIWHS